MTAQAGWIRRAAAAALGVLLGVWLCLPSSASAQDNVFAVSIASPAEGETLYAGPTTLLYTVEVRGWVTGTDDPADVSLQLEIFKDDVLQSRLITSPQPDGSYGFPVTVNPEGSEGNFTPVEVEAGCEDCHYVTANSFPNGVLRLKVTATDPQGRMAISERSIIVDRSAYTSVPVKVVAADDPGHTMPGITIEASTWIYEWRARHAYARTDETGITYLNLEALSQAPTRYIVKAQSSVQDGVFYEDAGALELTIPAGSEINGPVVVEVRRALELISGRIRFLNSRVPLPLTMWAVRVWDESLYQTSVDLYGRFRFSNMPLGRYILTADPAVLAELGWRTDQQVVELTSSSKEDIVLTATAMEGTRVEGQLIDSNGSIIPFGRVTVQDSSVGADILPSTARWSLYDAPGIPFTLIATAPGYLPANFEVDPDSRSTNMLALEPSPETQLLEWGPGSVTIPAGTQTALKNGLIQLSHGWIWGTDGGDAPLKVQLPNADITIYGGSFALEVVPGKINRLFIDKGHAEIVSRASGFKSEVSAGEMIDLTNPDRSIPVLQNAIVDQAIQAEYGIEIPRAYDPGAVTQQKTGVQTIAGIITLITYYLIFLILGALPLILIYWLIRRRMGSKPD
ncbi:MAG: hypothetical protein P8X64_14150 [Anaerolineales bacterium]|jgi:hypothetical protein